MRAMLTRWVAEVALDAVIGVLSLVLVGEAIVMLPLWVQP